MLPPAAPRGTKAPLNTPRHPRRLPERFSFLLSPSFLFPFFLFFPPQYGHFFGGGKLTIQWGKFFAENFCRETRTCSGSARTLARVSLHPHPPVCAPSAATRVLAARAAVLGARGGTLFSASACLSHRPACFRLLVQPLRRSRRFLWWSLYRCASVIN